MAGKGGFRPGSGRKPGSKNKLTKAAAAAVAQAHAEGVTPLAVMTRTMAALWKEAQTPAAPGKPAAIDTTKALKAHEVAKDAAPYMHPKLASIEQSGPGGGPILTKDLTDPENMLEAARRLAFTITMGAREAARQGAAPAQRTASAKKTVRA